MSTQMQRLPPPPVPQRPAPNATGILLLRPRPADDARRSSYHPPARRRSALGPDRRSHPDLPRHAGPASVRALLRRLGHRRGGDRHRDDVRHQAPAVRIRLPIGGPRQGAPLRRLLKQRPEGTLRSESAARRPAAWRYSRLTTELGRSRDESQPQRVVVTARHANTLARKGTRGPSARPADPEQDPRGHRLLLGRQGLDHRDTMPRRLATPGPGWRGGDTGPWTNWAGSRRFTSRGRCSW